MLTVADVMTSDPIVISPEATLRDAIEMLAAHDISGMPVVARHAVVGTISARDIVTFEAAIPGVPAQKPNDDFWEPDLPVFAEPDVPAGAYFAEMWEDAGGEVVERMAASASPEWDLLAEHTVEEAMSRNVLTIAPSADLEEAATYMTETGAHRMLVTERGMLRGLVTTMDITRAFAEHRLSDHPETGRAEDDL